MEKVKGVLFWILVAVVVGDFIGPLYWPLFASAEIVGRNTFYVAVIAIIIWRAYRFRNPKKKSQSAVKFVNELEKVRQEKGYVNVNDVARANDKVSKGN